MMRRFAWIVCLGAMALQGTGAAPSIVRGAEPTSEFSRTTIDLGMVVADVEKSVKFYTEVIGFRRVAEFAVGGEFASDAGLTDRVPLKIQVLALGEGNSATKLKLMASPDGSPRPSDNKFLNSQLGYRYLTIFVVDMNQAMQRLEKAGVPTLGKTPVPLPRELSSDLFLTCVRDPDGNFVELVGPKK